MKIFSGMYFKTLPDEKALISGLSLPRLPLNKQEDCPYTFIDCEIHPRLWEAMRQMYIPAGCKLENTYIGPN